mgnify:CR=1 FL=1
MAKQNQSTRQILIAWLLLALFMLPMVVKSVHVCQVESELAAGHKTTGQHSQSHDTETCKVCHFAFFNYMRATDIRLDAVAVIFFGFLFLSAVTPYRRPEVEVTSLRAPPADF